MPVTTIPVPLERTLDAAYDVVVGRGVLTELPRLLRERCPAHRYAIITDSRVRALYADRVAALLTDAGLRTATYVFPAGEWNKVRQTWADLTDRLVETGVGRDAAIVALGGGVVGDLAGFVAATLHRGIPYAQVPTTVLAMIDASVGGKTGLDLPAGKNLVGAFHQPRFVLADIETLVSLPRPHVAGGCAEAIKHGVIADREYAAAVGSWAPACLARDAAVLERLVERSVRIKAEIVAADVAERGRRQVLNFGHTVGHAVEARSGYSLLHGEAVAIGMAVEARLAEAVAVAEPGTCARLLDLLARFDLPAALPPTLEAADVLEAMRHDKKARAGALRFSLPKSFGVMAQSADGEWTVEIGSDDILAALQSPRPRDDSQTI